MRSLRTIALSLVPADFSRGYQSLNLRLRMKRTMQRGMWAGLGFLILTTLCTSAASPKRVLILDPFGREVAPYSAVVSTFRTTLARELGEPVDIYELPLDLARLSEAEGEGPLVAFMEGRIKSQPVDLVVPIGSPCLQFAARHRDRLFPDTPVLVLATPARVIPPDFMRTNATLVAQEVNIPGMVEDILQMQPQTTNIVVVFGASTLEKYWVNECRREFQSFTNRVGFTWLNDLPLEEILKRCAALPPRSFILHVLFVVDAAGIPCEKNESLRRLHETANAPLFGYYASQFGLGTIGGRLFQDTEVGAQGARVASRILRDESPGNIPAQMLPAPIPVFDCRELQRWGISEARLPAGSEVRFREPNFWERYRWPIAGTIAFCLLQAALIIGLLVSRARRRGAEERFRLVVEASPNGIVLVNNQGQIVMVNAQTEANFGYSRDELIGQGVEVLIPERFRGAHPEHRKEFVAAPRTRAMGAGRELFGRRKDGTEFPVEIGLSPIQIAQEFLVQTTIVDITGRKRAEAELLRQRMELARAGRITLLGQLASALAHELSQPLGAILRNAEAAEIMLQEASPDSEELRAIVADILRDDQRAGQVIDRLRSLLKGRSLVTQPVELPDVIAEVFSLVHAEAAARHVKLACSSAPGLPRVLGDRIHLQQVLLNLLVNALDAMDGCAPNGRSIQVSVSQVDPTTVEVCVADHGPGIPVESLARLFEPFFTTKAKGMGMGLPVSRTIIEAHKGKLWAENRPGGGACFRFTVPVAVAGGAS
jgi:PAS domain S-box-containing protein